MTINYNLSLDLSSTDTENLFFWKENVYKLVNHHYVAKQPFKLARVVNNGQLLWETDGASFCTKVIVCHSDNRPLLLHICYVSHGLQEVSYFVSNLALKRESGVDSSLGANAASDVGLHHDLNSTTNNNGRFTDGFNPHKPPKRAHHSGAAAGAGKFDHARVEWSRISSHDFYLRFHRLVDSNQVLKEFDLVLGKPDQKNVFLNRSGKLLVDVYVPNVGHRLKAVRDGMREVWRAASPNVRCTTVFAHPKASYCYLHLVIEGYVEGSEFAVDSDGFVAGSSSNSGFASAANESNSHTANTTTTGGTGRYFKTDLFFKKAFLRWNRISRTDYFNFFELDFGRTGLNNEVCNLDKDLYCYYYKNIGLNLDELNELLLYQLESTPYASYEGAVLKKGTAAARPKDVRFSELEFIYEYFYVAKNHFHSLTNVFVTPKAGFLLKQLELDSFQLCAGANEFVLYLNLHYYLGELASFYLILSRREGESALYFLKRDSSWVSVTFSQYMASFSNYSYFTGLAAAPNAVGADGSCLSGLAAAMPLSGTSVVPGSATAVDAVSGNKSGAQPEAAVTRLSQDQSHASLDQASLRTLSCPPGSVSLLDCSTNLQSAAAQQSSGYDAMAEFSKGTDAGKFALDLTGAKLPRTYSMLSTKSTSRSSSFNLTRKGKVLSNGSLSKLRNNLSTLKYNLINIRHHFSGLSSRKLPNPSSLGPTLLSKNISALSARNASKHHAAPVRAPRLIKLNELLKKRGKDEPFMGRIFSSSFRNKKNLLIRTYFSPAENYSHPKRVFKNRFLRGGYSPYAMNARWPSAAHEPLHSPSTPNPTCARSTDLPLSGFSASNESENDFASGANSSDSDAVELATAAVNATKAVDSASVPGHAHELPGVSAAASYNRGWPTRRSEARLSRRTRLRNRLAKMHRGSFNTCPAPSNRSFNSSGKLSADNLAAEGAVYAGKTVESGKLFSNSKLFSRSRLFHHRGLGNSNKNVILVGGLASTFLEAFMSVNVNRFLQTNDYLNLNPYLNYVPKFNALASIYVSDVPPRACSECDLNRLDSSYASSYSAAGCVNAVHNARLLLSKKFYRKYGELFNSSCYYGDDLLDVFRTFSYTGSFVEMLNKLGYNVYSLDLQSHGLSEGARDLKCFSENFQDYVDDLVQFLGIIKAGRFFDNSQTYSAFGPERGHASLAGAFSYFPINRGEYVLIGFSMGANIAVQAIADHSANVAKCLDASPALGKPGSASSDHSNFLNASTTGFGSSGASTSLNVVDKFISVNGMYNLKDLCGRVARFMFPFICRITSFFVPSKVSAGGISKDYATSFRVYKSFQDAYYYVYKHRHLKCSQLFRACDAVFKKISQYPSNLKTLIIHSINDKRCHINGANRLFENINNSCNDYVPVNSDFHSITNYEFVGIMRDIISKILVQ